MLRREPRAPGGAVGIRVENAPQRRGTADKTTLKRRPALAVDMLEAVTARTVGFRFGSDGAMEVSPGWV
jgi:hypothetical protein